MIFGIGVDVLEAARVKKLYERYGEHFVERLLMPAEREQMSKTKRTERFLAMRFAAKASERRCSPMRCWCRVFCALTEQ